MSRYLKLVLTGSPDASATRFDELLDESDTAVIPYSGWKEREDGYFETVIEPRDVGLPEFPELEVDPGPDSANERQEGGGHYKGLALEPWDLTVVNGLDPFQHEIQAYVQRWRDKGGLVDLEKALHWLQKYIEVVKLYSQLSGGQFMALRTPPGVALAILKAAVAKLERS